jgi:hypothetical protein
MEPGVKPLETIQTKHCDAMTKPFKIPKRPKPPPEPPRKYKTGDWVATGDARFPRIAQITGYGFPFGKFGPHYEIRYIDEFGTVTATGQAEEFLRPAEDPDPLPTPAAPPLRDW